MFIAPYLCENIVTWSLSLECAYYVIAPVLRRMPSVIVVVAIVISAIVFAQSKGIAEKWQLANWHNIVYLAWAWLGGFLIRKSGHSIPIVGACALAATCAISHYGFQGAEIAAGLMIALGFVRLLPKFNGPIAAP
jgi:peptidoglycan/LPS O-acetylase OafA/YrhL